MPLRGRHKKGGVVTTVMGGDMHLGSRIRVFSTWRRGKSHSFERKPGGAADSTSLSLNSIRRGADYKIRRGYD